MAFALLLLSMIASTPTTTTVTPSITKAASTPQSSKETIQSAQKYHNRVFMGYVLLLVLTAFVTYWVWSSGNKVQDAIQVEAGARIEEAKRKTAELERETLKLRQDLADRRITKEQHDILVHILSKRRGRIIIETMSTGESGLFAADILQTFIDSGWEISDKHFPQGVVWIGLILYETSDPNALTVADALKAAGIPFKIGNEKREKATIMVGGKPPMF